MNSKINLIGDPKYIGPGVWYVIHLKAKDSTDDLRITQFIDFMYMLTEKFSCKNCRKHMTAYITTHPMEHLRNLEDENGTRIGMFKWAWLFHNAVNTRIHKPLVDWETAWEMYDNPEICSKACDETEDNEVEIISEIPQNRGNVDRRSQLAQGYFMSVGIPQTLENNGVSIPDNTVSFRPITN